MAEGWLRSLHVDRFEALSAGTAPHGLNPTAVQVMAEAGVDISTHRSKHLDEFRQNPPDLVITVCDHAHETCPVFPGATRTLHRGFDDPPALAKAASSETAALMHYRRVRDEIRQFVESLPEMLKADGAQRRDRV